MSPRGLDGRTLTVTSGDEALPATAAPPADAPRTVGRYTLLERVGEGGMGVVWAAWDPRLDRKVALKLLRDSQNAARALRMWREARALARVNHANVVTVHDVDSAGDCVFVAMELIDGVTLRRWVDAHVRDHRAIIRGYRDAACGLVAAHAHGIVHRDFKPDNVLVDKRDHVRVVDFGLVGFGAPDAVVPVAEHERAAPEPLTSAGALLGTRGYTAPEQLRGAAPHPAADQFSFCVSLFEALFGYRPYDPKTLARLSQSGDELSPQLPPAHDVPRPIVEALLRGLHIAPERRFPSMQALVDALDNGQTRRRRRWLALLLLALVIAAASAWRLTAPARQRVETAQSLAHDSERLRASLRESRLLPLHDLSREKQELRRQLTLMQAELASPEDAPAEVAQAIGFGRFELGELDAARPWLEAAWQNGARTSELEATLGELLARLYERHQTRWLPLSAEERAREANLMETSLRQPAQRHLQAAEAGLTRAAQLVVEARLAELEQKLDRALALAGQAAAVDANAGAPIALQARLEVARAWQGERDAAAIRALATAEQAWHARLAALSRSDEQLYEAAAQDLIDVAILALARDWLPRKTIEAALSACTAATLADTDSPALLLSARLHMALADYQAAHGQDARAELTAAATEARTYASRHADDRETRWLLATILSRQALLELAAGRDPRALLHEAAGVSDGSAAARSIATDVAASLASYDRDHGASPRSDYARATTLAGRRDLLTLRPRAELAFADAAWRTGDVTPALERAALDLTRALRLDPKDALALREQAWLDFLRWRSARTQSAMAKARARATQSSSRALAMAGEDVTLNDLVHAEQLGRTRLRPSENVEFCRRAQTIAPRAPETAEICAQIVP